MEPFKKVFYTNSPEETIELGRQIGSRLKGGEIIAYKGGLGAGKTTITRGIALGMGQRAFAVSFRYVPHKRRRGSGNYGIF